MSGDVAVCWDEPAGATPRGTVVVVPGRGEGPAEYQRLGRRLAADSWKVRLVPADLGDVRTLRAAVERALADDTLPAPKVLVGADAAATWIGRYVDELDADAAVVAGAALSTSAAVTGWEQELEARSACPLHRGVLRADAHFERGALSTPVPAEWTRSAPPTKPTLVLHGDADPVTQLDQAVAPYTSSDAARVKVVRGGRHDVLNDAVHRVVAATVVLFLESLRLGADLPAIVVDMERGRVPA